MSARRTIAATALALAGCVEQLPGLDGTQSLAVELDAPRGVGGQPADERLDPADEAQRTVNVRVRALDEQGLVDTSFDGEVAVRVQYLGSLTPDIDDPPQAEIALTAGESELVSLTLPPVFGPSFLWVEDALRPEASYATGTSPTLWFRDPFLEDVSRPDDEAALDALQTSPLEDKQVAVTASRHGARGRLVVTGVYAQGYTVSDVECADDAGTPPCVTGAYDHVLVFTFSRPQDEEGRDLAVGQVIDGFTGAVVEFNGLTEISFPQTFAFAAEPLVRPDAVPEPFVIDPAWLSQPIQFERVESALVAVDGGVVCELDDDYEVYKQWKLDLGRGCQDAVNVITSGVADVDPTALVGQTLPRVVGTLRPVNIGSFNVWIIFPRSSADLTLP